MGNKKNTGSKKYRSKIMLIEDEEAFAQTLKFSLEDTGKYEVMVLLDAKDVISKINKFKPDIILLDLLLPKIGGLEVCEMLNKDSFGRTIPIIVLSALKKNGDKRKAYKLGVVDYLVKPVNIETLTATIDKHIQYKSESEP